MTADCSDFVLSLSRPFQAYFKPLLPARLSVLMSQTAGGWFFGVRLKGQRSVYLCCHRSVSV